VDGPLGSDPGLDPLGSDPEDDKITCPLLVIHGENDRQVPLWHAERTIEAAVNSRERELKVCRLADGAAEHCGAHNGPLIVDYMTDWVADKLGR
jgi:dipeptidyl aminopeptidase/acylaminoacyl peptidase